MRSSSPPPASQASWEAPFRWRGSGQRDAMEALGHTEAALSEGGLGLSQALMLLLTSLITFTSAVEVYMLSMIGLDMQCYWGISPSEAASLFTTVFLVRSAEGRPEIPTRTPAGDRCPNSSRLLVAAHSVNAGEMHRRANMGCRIRSIRQAASDHHTVHDHRGLSGRVRVRPLVLVVRCSPPRLWICASGGQCGHCLAAGDSAACSPRCSGREPCCARLITPPMTRP